LDNILNDDSENEHDEWYPIEVSYLCDLSSDHFSILSLKLEKMKCKLSQLK
jgi:hypothetical protein